MKDEYEVRLFELLGEAIEWPVAERRARAEARCREEPVTATALLAALERRERLDDFLERPAWEDATGLIVGVDEDSAPAVSWQPGQSVGRYRLLSPLGQGGMGEVFLAEQEDPDRRVALKLIRADGMSTATLDRFRVEQQALARLSHPNVAQLYEAGLTEDGLPFFAMEWVDGRPIDTYLADRPPDLASRLDVFLAVCSAVRHAHQKQVVHRDLKPSNVLLQEDDGESIVKVIDFGVAEALDRPAGSVRVTERGGIYGTPEYLSPEAFDGDIDTRSDVYALGVLLYELVSGTRPFQRASGDLSALVQRIRQGDAAPPSEAIAAELSFETPSARRRWIDRVRGDLDAIVGRAMHRDRDQRYDTVADLAADIGRFRAYEPVAARTAGTWHRLTLLSRRRRGAMIAASVALAGLLAGGVGLTAGLVRARQEAEATQRALTESQELSGFLTDLFQQSDPNRVQGSEVTARELLDQGRERLASGALADQPLAQARFSRTIGEIYGRMAYFDASIEMLDTARARFASALGADHPEVASTFHSLGVAKTKTGSNDAARVDFERALAIQEVHPDVAPSDLALTLYHLGAVAFRTRDLESAERYFARACPMWEASGEDEYRARCLEAYGRLLERRGDDDRAEALYRASLALRARILGPDHPHLAASLDSLCGLNRSRLALESADEDCARALRIREQAFGDNHYLTVSSLTDLAIVRRLEGQYADAEALFLRALAGAQADPENSRRQEASTWIRLGWVAWQQAHYDDALDRYRSALTFFEESPEIDKPSEANAIIGLGLTAWKQGRFADAERHLMRARVYFQGRFGDDSTGVAWTSWGLAGVYRDRADPALKDLDRAGALYQHALDVRRGAYPEGHEYLALTEADYAAYLERVAEHHQRQGS